MLGLLLDVCKMSRGFYGSWWSFPLPHLSLELQSGRNQDNIVHNNILIWSQILSKDTSANYNISVSCVGYGYNVSQY